MNKELFLEFKETYLRLQKLLFKSYQETKDLEIKEMIETTSKNYEQAKGFLKEKGIIKQ